MPNLMVLGGGAFGRYSGQEGGALMNGINVLIKETPEISLQDLCNLGDGPHPTMLAPDLGLPASKSVRNQFLMFISY